MKTFKEFLADKGHDKAAFDLMDSAEQGKLFAEYNEACNKAIDDKVEAKASKEEVEAAKTDLQAKFDEAIKEMKITAQLEAKIEKANEANKKLEKAMKAQGEATQSKLRQEVSSLDPWSDFKEKFETESNDVSEKSRDEISFKFTAKEALTFTTSAVPTGTYAPGTVANATGALLDQQSYEIQGIHQSPKRIPDFMNRVTNRVPIENGIMHAVTVTAENGNAAIVEEGAVKPYANVEFGLDKVSTRTIAVLWKEARQWRKNFARLLPFVRKHMAELVSTVLESEVYASITGSSFTPVAGLTFTTPKKLEAIGATIYSMANSEFYADTVLVNPIDYATMVHSRAGDGHYDVFNNGSINMINRNQIIAGGRVVTMSMSTKVAPGAFFVGDMSKLTYGAENQVEYAQGYVDDDFARNLITNRLELDIATLIPSVYNGAFVKDTYAVVIPQITTA